MQRLTLILQWLYSSGRTETRAIVTLTRLWSAGSPLDTWYAEAGREGYGASRPPT
jgi:hypothetical protein